MQILPGAWPYTKTIVHHFSEIHTERGILCFYLLSLAALHSERSGIDSKKGGEVIEGL